MTKPGCRIFACNSLGKRTSSEGSSAGRNLAADHLARLLVLSPALCSISALLARRHRSPGTECAFLSGPPESASSSPLAATAAAAGNLRAPELVLREVCLHSRRSARAPAVAADAAAAAPDANPLPRHAARLPADWSAAFPAGQASCSSGHPAYNACAFLRFCRSTKC